MYSLLISAEVEGMKSGTFTVPNGRYLEYTAPPMESQLRVFSNDAIECLKSWPCLLMSEGRTNELACIGKIVSLSSSGAGARLEIQPFLNQPKLINDAIWKLRTELDLEHFEFSRTHFAVKDRDLFGVLGAAGYRFDPAVTSQFSPKPLPAPARSQLIAAIGAIAALSHTEIDRLLLEWGVSGLDAPSTLGSKRARATAIVKYAIDHPASTTAENDLFSALLVRRVGQDAATSQPVAPPPADINTAQVQSTTSASASPNRVFVVHGRNDVARDEVVAFLSEVGLEAIVLHEQPNMGRHLLTKFVDEAALVTFAVILMTDDDLGSVKGGQVAPRARQNVILELGYFLSHLGQARVCAMKTHGLETPSDFDGIVYITMDASQNWKRELLRELKAAAMPVTGG